MTLRRLTPEEVKFYKDNGFLAVEGLFSNEECDRVLAICKKHADKDLASIMNIDRVVPEMAAVVKDPRSVSIIETLQGTEIVALMSQVLFKEVGSPYASQAWNPHQDNAYPQAEHGAYITTNLFLADADPENGSLYLFSGSHKEKLLPSEPTISYHERPGTNPGNTVRVPEKYKKHDLVIKKGGMIVLHGDLIHGSYSNRSKTRSRPLFSVSYITKGTSFIPGKNAKRMAIPVR